MRIAFLTPEFITESTFSGGLANYLFRTCIALKQYGHEPVIFVIAQRDQTFSYKGIEVNRVKSESPLFYKMLDKITLNKLSQKFFKVSASQQLGKAFKKAHIDKPFDVAQASNYYLTNLFIKRDIPCVVRISSYEPYLKRAYEVPNSISSILNEWLEIHSLKKADGIYAPTKLIGDKVEHAIKKKVRVIEPIFIPDTEYFDPSFYNKNLKGKHYLLFFGKISLLKGCKEIADILTPLLSKYPNLFFVFAGPTVDSGEKKMFQYIQEKTLSVADRVIYAGKMKHDKLYPIIKNARGVVLPSRADNFPNTCIEAMYFSQIVVGTRQTGFDQLIEDGKSGFLCTPKDSDSLLFSIESLLALSKEQAQDISETAKKRVDMLSPEHTVPKLINFFEDIINMKTRF